MLFFSLMLVAGLLAALLLYVVLLSRHRKASTGELRVTGARASVVEPLEPEGAVMVRGELWRARAASGARVGRGRENVRVVGARGHLLEVEPVE